MRKFKNAASTFRRNNDKNYPTIGFDYAASFLRRILLKMFQILSRMSIDHRPYYIEDDSFISNSSFEVFHLIYDGLFMQLACRTPPNT